MAYNFQNLEADNTINQRVSTIWHYTDLNETLAAMSSSGFIKISDNSDNLASLIKVGDVVLFSGSDGVDWAAIESISPIVTVSIDGGGSIPKWNISTTTLIATPTGVNLCAPIPFNVVATDTFGGYDVLTGLYTVPKDGFYSIQSTIQTSASGLQLSGLASYLIVNGEKFFNLGQPQEDTVAFITVVGAISLDLTEGDQIGVGIYPFGSNFANTYVIFGTLVDPPFGGTVISSFFSGFLVN